MSRLPWGEDKNYNPPHALQTLRNAPQETDTRRHTPHTPQYHHKRARTRQSKAQSHAHSHTHTVTHKYTHMHT